MAISVTAAAAEHVGKQLAARGRGEGIRIGVKPWMFWARAYSSL